MDEIENNKQKPKISKLAILSPLLLVFFWLIGISFSFLFKDIFMPDWIFLLIFTIFILASIIVGILALYKIHKSRGGLAGRFTAILGIVVAAFLAFIIFCTCALPPEFLRQRIVCGTNLRELGLAINSYSLENEGKYPVPDKWCDLIKSKGTTKRDFMCPSSKAERCSYAINPNCEPNSPKDMVLLFETKGGWDRFGGPELLTTENHKGEGCNILFNDGRVNFIPRNKIEQLKWKTE